MKNAAMVGVLVVVFVALVIGSFAVLGRTLLPSRRQTYFADLPDAGGVSIGTRVLMAGVQIGTIDKVDLLTPHEARFVLHLEPKFKIPRGSELVIQSSLVGLGDTPVEIVAPETPMGFLPEGSTIPGRRAGALDAVLPNGGRDLYAHVDQTLQAVQKLLQDKGLQNDLKRLLENANTTLKASQKTLASFAALGDRTNGLLARNEGDLDAMVKATRGTIQQVQYTASTLASFVRQGKLQNGTTQILDKATRIEGQASDLLAQLDKVIGSPKVQSDLRGTVHNVKETSDRGPAIADNAQKITANVAEITEKAKPLPDELNEVATKASKLEDKLGSLLDKVNGLNTPSMKGLRALSTEFDEIRETNPSHWRSDINGRLPTHDGFVTFGVYDAFESDKFNLEVGHNASPNLDFRYGAYASKPAVGVDYWISRRLGLITDLWNVNSPEFDARLKYNFGGGVVGWVGAESIFSKTAPVFGLGIVK